MYPRTFLSVLLLSVFVAPALAQRFSIVNPNTVPVENAPVVVSAASLPGFISTDETLRVTVDGKQVKYQIDDLNRDGKPDELIFLVNLKAGERAKVNIKPTRKPVPKVESQVVASLILKDKDGKWHQVDEASSTKNDMYNQMHHHGAAFESDKIAYRIYFDNKSTIDIYGKKQYRLELPDTWWYPTDEQLAAGYGDDILLVSGWVGIGTLKGWNGKMLHIDRFGKRTQRLLAKGPLRTIAESEVEGWEYEGKKAKVTVRYILYAGHRDVTAEVISDTDLTAVATGVQQIGGGEMLSTPELVGSWGSWHPQPDTVKYAKETVGLGLYLPAGYQSFQFTEGVNNLIRFPLKKGEVVRYYFTTIAAKETGQPVQDARAFFEHLNAWKKGLEPIRIIR